MKNKYVNFFNTKVNFLFKTRTITNLGLLQQRKEISDWLHGFLYGTFFTNRININDFNELDDKVTEFMCYLGV